MSSFICCLAGGVPGLTYIQRTFLNIQSRLGLKTIMSDAEYKPLFPTKRLILIKRKMNKFAFLKIYVLSILLFPPWNGIGSSLSRWQIKAASYWALVFIFSTTHLPGAALSCVFATRGPLPPGTPCSPGHRGLQTTEEFLKLLPPLPTSLLLASVPRASLGHLSGAPRPAWHALILLNKCLSI